MSKGQKNFLPQSLIWVIQLQGWPNSILFKDKKNLNHSPNGTGVAAWPLWVGPNRLPIKYGRGKTRFDSSSLKKKNVLARRQQLDLAAPLKKKLVGD